MNKAREHAVTVLPTTTLETVTGGLLWPALDRWFGPGMPFGRPVDSWSEAHALQIQRAGRL